MVAKTATTNNLYQHSGRLSRALAYPDELGFSCNYLSLEDSLDSITNGYRWAKFVASRNGAPSVNFSALRPKGAPIARGGGKDGGSTGAVSFMYDYDTIIATTKRTSKNNAGLLGLHIDHPDFDEFVEARFKVASKVVYVPVPETQDEAERIAKKLAPVWGQPKLFIHKQSDPNMGTNLCTEILMHSKDNCVLGTFNLAGLNDLSEFEHEFTKALMSLVGADVAVHTSNQNNPLYLELVNQGEENRHVGLSITGLATFLAHYGVTYRELAHLKTPKTERFWETMQKGYAKARQTVLATYPQYKRFFCQAPLVHSHRNFFDARTGLAVSPSLEPVEGSRLGGKVVTRIVSKDGNIIQEHPGNVETVRDVSPYDYFEICDKWQRLLLDQSISFSVFDDANDPIDKEYFIYRWLCSSLHSLYYYVPVPPVDDSVLEDKFTNIPVACDFGKWKEELLDSDCGCAS